MKKPLSFTSGGSTDTLPINPELEAFFTAVALQLGTNSATNLQPQEREDWVKLVFHRAEIRDFIRDHPGAPDVINTLRRNYAELGGRLLNVDPNWFYDKLAQAYLAWVVDQGHGNGVSPKD